MVKYLQGNCFYHAMKASSVLIIGCLLMLLGDKPQIPDWVGYTGYALIVIGILSFILAIIAFTYKHKAEADINEGLNERIDKIVNKINDKIDKK